MIGEQASAAVTGTGRPGGKPGSPESLRLAGTTLASGRAVAGVTAGIERIRECRLGDPNRTLRGEGVVRVQEVVRN